MIETLTTATSSPKPADAGDRLAMDVINRDMSEASCISCRRALTVHEVACGDGQCLACFERAEDQ